MQQLQKHCSVEKLGQFQHCQLPVTLALMSAVTLHPRLEQSPKV